MSLQTVVRAGNWWSSKIPPLLAIAYAEILLHETPATLSIRLVLATFWSICAVASYGHVINDIFDIEQDRLAGKRNFMAPYRPPAQAFFTLLTILAGVVPLLWINVGTSAWILLAINYLLPTVYSIPPLRFKERGILGVLCDTSGAHAIPTLFIATAFANNAAAPSSQANLFTWVAGIWAFLFGLKGILNHMIADRASDIVGGARTFAVDTDPMSALRFMNRVLYWFEVVAFFGVVFLLRAESTVLLPLLFIYCGLELTKGALGWKFSFDATGTYVRRNVPFANNRFYELWFPVALVAQVASVNPKLFWLPLVHLWLFRANIWEQAEDLSLFFRSLFHTLRNYRYWNRFHALLDVQKGCAASLVSSPIDAQVTRACIGRTTGTPWHIKSLHGSYALRGGSRYRVSLRARADQSRPMSYGICQRVEPWEGLGLSESIDLGTEWKVYIADFVCTHDDPAAAVYLWLGGDQASVEVSNVCCYAIQRGEQWYLDRLPDNRANLTIPDDNPSALRLEIAASTGAPSGVKLSQGSWQLRAGEAYTVSFQARADRPRRVLVSVSESNEPWSERGLNEDVVLSDIWHEHELTFLANADDESAFVSFSAGAHTSSIEISGLALRSAEARNSWRIETAGTGQAHRSGTSPGGVTVAVDNSSDHADDVTLSYGCWRLSNDATYRVTFYAHAKRPGTVTIGVSQIRPPWEGLGLAERIELDEAGRSYQFDFRATRDEGWARLQWGLALLKETVDIASVRLEPIPSGERWELARADRSVAHLETLQEFPGGVRLVIRRTSGIAEDVKLTQGHRSTEKGKPYRVTFRARALSPTYVRVAFAQAIPPWTNLDLDEWIEVGGRWNSYSLDFVANRSEPEACVVFFAGQKGTALEIANVTVVDGEHGDPWRIGSGGNAILVRDDALPGESLQVHMPIPSPPAGKGSVSRGRWQVIQGDAYRAVLRVRSGEEVTAEVSLRQIEAPWQGLGLSRSLSLTPGWETLLFDFVATATEETACLDLRFGPMARPLQVERFTLEAIAAEDYWELSVSGGADARLLRSEDAAGSLAVVVKENGAHAYDVKLSGRRQSLARGTVYRLSFRARCSSPRWIGVAIALTRPPWTNLGLQEETRIGTEWQSLTLTFVAHSDADAGFHLLLGTTTGAVEIADVRIEATSDSQSWSLTTTEGARAFRQSLEPEGTRIRAVIVSQADNPLGIKLLRGPWPIDDSHFYLLEFRARADSPRYAVVGVQQAQPPWSGLGLSQEIQLGDEWKTFRCPFRASGRTQQANVVFGIGSESVPIEVDAVNLLPVEPGSLLMLEQSPQCKAQLLATADAAGVRLEIAKTSGVPSELKLAIGRHTLRRQQRYRLTFEAKSDLPRSVFVTVGQSSEPWLNLGIREAIELTTALARHELNFLATDDDEAARISFHVGAADIPLELANVSLTQVAPGLTWRIESDEGVLAFRTRTIADGIRFKIRQGQPGCSVRVTAAPWDVRAGEFYRLTFRGQAAASAAARVSIAAAHPPWTGLGFSELIDLTSQPADYFFDFIATGEESFAGVQFELPGTENTVELEQLTLVTIRLADAWRMQKHRDCVARFTPGEDFPQAIRLVIEQSDGVAEHVRLAHGSFPLEAGGRYQIRFRARAKDEHWLAFGAQQAGTAGRGLSSTFPAKLTNTWQEVAAEFIAPSEDQAAVVCWFGGQSGVVDVAGIEIVPVEHLGQWQLSGPPDCQARLEASADGKVAHVQMEKEGQTPAKLLASIGRVVEGTDYELLVRMRASRITETTLAVAQMVSPWRGLGMGVTLKVSTEWKNVYREFRATANESNAVIQWSLVGMESFDVGEVSFAPIVDDGRWRLKLGGEAHGALLRQQCPDAVQLCMEQSDGVAEHVRLSFGKFPLHSGQTQRLSFRACSIPATWVNIDVLSSESPIHGMGLAFACSLGSDWQEVSVPFRPTGQDEAAAVVFWAGECTGKLAIEDVCLEPANDTPSWQLECNPGVHAQLEFMETAADGCRVIIEQAGGKPQDIRLAQPLPPLVAGQSYLVRLRARADSTRNAILTIQDWEYPFEGRGCYDSFSLAAEWQTYRWTFVSNGDASAAAARLFLGGEAIGVEVDFLFVTPADPSNRWTLTRAAGAQATLLEPEGRPGILVRAGKGTGNANDLTVVHGHHPLRVGTAYRLALTLRAQIAGWVGVLARQSLPPWMNLGLVEEVFVDTSTRMITLDFLAKADADDAVVQLSLGALSGEIEIADWSLVPLPTKFLWQVARQANCRARLTREDENGALLRMEVVATDGDPWHLLLYRNLLPLNKQAVYRIRYRIRAPEEFMVPCIVAQGHPPWTNLGYYRELAVGPEWLQVDHTFTANEAEEDPRFAIALGRVTSALELAEFAFELVDVPGPVMDAE